MNKYNIIAITVLASALALGGCGKIKELLGKAAEEKPSPEPAEGKDTGKKKEEAEKKPDTEKKAETKKEEAKEEPPAEEEAEAEEEPPAEEEEAEEEEEPAGSAEVKSDIPKSVRSAAKIKKVLVIGNPSENSKYAFTARKANPAIKECHRSALVDKPGAVGKIKFKVTITPKGKVKKVDVDKNKTGSDDLAACVAEAFKAIDWPKQTEGEKRTLAIPIMFVKP